MTEIIMLLTLSLYFYISRHMDINYAIIALSALSQETRLRVFKLLIEYGTEGAPAGRISEQLDIPHNTMSFHLAHLSHAGLVTSRRVGRSIIYSANHEAMKSLMAFMSDNCCVREKSPKCCQPPKKGSKP